MCRLIIGHCQASNVLFTTLIFCCFDSSKHKQNSIFAVLRTFRSLNANIFLPLYKTLLRTHLDYVSSVWAPYKKKYIDKIESVQKQIPGFNNLSYPERLKKIKVPTMAYRRIRGDMIETYKIINEKYDPEASSFLKLLSNSGNRFSRRNNSNKIVQQRFQTSLRKNSFDVRVAKVWKKLPDRLIVNSYQHRNYIECIPLRQTIPSKEFYK